MTTPKRQQESPLRQLDALRNLITAQESLERAAQRLAGVRRQVLEEVAAVEPCAGEVTRR